MVNKELLMVFIPGISWILFALGGTQISDKVPGWKGWRRYILPLFYVLCCLLVGIDIYKSIIVGLISCIAFCLGYGDKTPWWMKVLVGCAYGAITLPIGYSLWNIITVIMFAVLFYLSNTKMTSKIFVWKICEGFFGLFCGIELAYILMR